LEGAENASAKDIPRPEELLERTITIRSFPRKR
jgi:hypothetical protein